jgi:hypothetical protein
MGFLKIEVMKIDKTDTTGTRGKDSAGELKKVSPEERGMDATASRSRDDPYWKICELIKSYDEFLRQCDECFQLIEEEQRRERLMEQQSWFNRLKSTLGRIKQIYINKSKMKTE